MCNSSKLAIRGNTASVTNLYVAGGGLYGFAGCLPEVVPNIVKVDLCVNHCNVRFTLYLVT